MLDSETEIRAPHAATRTRKGGRTTTTIDDPRVSVTMQDQGAALTLFFDPDHAFTGDAQLLEVRLSPPKSGKFEPWRLMPRLPLHLQYARASLAWDDENVTAALDAMRQLKSRGRALSDEFLRLVARVYTQLVDEGERYPVATLADLQPVDISTASRWISAARARGYLPKEDQQR